MRVSPYRGHHRYGTVLRTDNRRCKALVLWDGTTKPTWWGYTELVDETSAGLFVPGTKVTVTGTKYLDGVYTAGKTIKGG